MIATELTTKERVRALIGQLCAGLYEREEAMKLALLSALAGESIFLLGPPGVGKSLIARRLKLAFRDGVSFEYLMSRFSTPDEVFGPVSIKKLKEEDKYERLTTRYLPGANVVFLDEIWKAGPAIQNALLTILNEKIYRNGDQDLQVNLRGIITASNELPPPNQSLDPIWDRFLVRYEMGNIRQLRHFVSMITATDDVYALEVDPALQLEQTLLDQWEEAIQAIDLPPEVLNTLQVLKMRLEEHNARPAQADHPILVNDRRWKKMVRLLRTAAFLNGRPAVDLMDCFLLTHCLWTRPAQKPVVEEMVAEAIRRHGYTLAVNLTMLRKEVEAFETDVNSEIQVQHRRTAEQLLVVEEDYYELIKEDQQFEGLLLPIKQFKQLELGNPKVCNFYDGAKNLVNRLQAQLGSSEFSIEVIFNDRIFTYPLKTKKVEVVEIIPKAPHPVVRRYWEERNEQLQTYLRQQLDHLVQHQPELLQHLDDNLFVEAAKSSIVKSNLTEVAAALRSLALQLEKIQYSYSVS